MWELGGDLDPVGLAWASGGSLLTFQGGAFVVVLFVNCYVVFHFLRFFLLTIMLVDYIQFSLDGGVSTFLEMQRVANPSCR